jgi:hypothetical protein
MIRVLRTRNSEIELQRMLINSLRHPFTKLPVQHGSTPEYCIDTVLSIWTGIGLQRDSEDGRR